MAMEFLMSYIVLARKYRPQTFSEVYSQEHITEVLSNAISSNRIAHAYLFTGPRGVGKTSMARIMAKNLNCVEGPTLKPCNKCTNCLEITASTSSDVIEIDGASNTGVEDIRELQRELLYAPSKSKYKIYIIDEVHMLSKNAFNALLKTLEEPPDNVIFIFATTEPYKVLPTIISRCQRYDFKRIPIDSIIRRLNEITGQEKIEIDNESLHMIARKADGSLRDALSLLDQVLSYCQDKVTIEKLREIFGLIPTQIHCNIMKLIHSGDKALLLAELQRIFEKGTDLQEFINNMMEFLRLVILRKVGMTPLEIPSEEYQAYDEIAGLFSQNSLMYIMSILTQTRNEIKSSGNPYLIFEMTMIKLCQLDEMEDISRIINKLSTLPGSSKNVSRPQEKESAQVSRQRPGPATTPAPSLKKEREVMEKLDFNQENLDKSWDRIAGRIKRISTTAGLAVEKCDYKALEGFKLHLKVTSKTYYSQLESKKDEITKVLAEVFSKPVRLELELEEGAIPEKVEICRKTLDDLKKQNENLARFIEITDSKLITGR